MKFALHACPELLSFICNISTRWYGLNSSKNRKPSPPVVSSLTGEAEKTENLTCMILQLLITSHFILLYPSCSEFRVECWEIMTFLNLPFCYRPPFKLGIGRGGNHHPHARLTEGECGARLRRNERRTEGKRRKDRKKLMYVVHS